MTFNAPQLHLFHLSHTEGHGRGPCVAAVRKKGEFVAGSLGLGRSDLHMVFFSAESCYLHDSHPQNNILQTLSTLSKNYIHTNMHTLEFFSVKLLLSKVLLSICTLLEYESHYSSRPT